MFSIFANAWKVKDIRKKMGYVVLMLLIYRLGCHIPLPGINGAELLASKGGASQGLFAMIAGGGYGSIFAMGIAPYITASIIMQLLTVAIPALEQIQKEGEEGRKKIGQYTRIVAVALALLQGAGTVYSLQNLFTNRNWLTYITATVAIVTGTMFIMWISELLTEKAIGNGSSFIIFANILSGIPTGFAYLQSYVAGENGTALRYILLILVLVIFVIIIGFVVCVQDGERRIPVQYSKKMVGKQMFGGQSSFIPIKVNIAGVMSIIFALSLMQLPQVISQFWKPAWITTLMIYLNHSHPVGAVLYVLLIFAFTFFYTSFAINPVEMAENMKKNGGFVPGIRPGKPTSEYIQRTIDRLSWIGALFYALIAMIPIAIQAIFKIQVGIGGTTLLIVVGVALELVKQLESQLLMRHYKGFLS